MPSEEVMARARPMYLSSSMRETECWASVAMVLNEYDVWRRVGFLAACAVLLLLPPHTVDRSLYIFRGVVALFNCVRFTW